MPSTAIKRALTPAVRTSRRWWAGASAQAYYRPRYRWRHPVLFIAGLPKSGTTWLAQLLSQLPGYRLRWPVDADRCLLNHDLCEASLAGLPWSGYSVVRTHTRPTPSNLTLIGRFNLRAVVMYRDPRDHCVSRYFHALHDPTHRHHRLYNSITRADGLSHSIELALEESIPWIEGWLTICASQPDRFQPILYRQLQSDPTATLARVLSFYDVQLAAERVTAMVERVAAQTRFDLARNLRTKRGTARKGIVGDWRNHFSADHVRRFHAGAGAHLTRWGFEPDDAWASGGHATEPAERGS
jgi:hypothetical protein